MGAGGLNSSMPHLSEISRSAAELIVTATLTVETPGEGFVEITAAAHVHINYHDHIRHLPLWANGHRCQQRTSGLRAGTGSTSRFRAVWALL
jgi:hypothetical protein